jgi:hypothetical protein
MRIASMLMALVMVVGSGGPARADARLVKKYAGQIVIAPDPVPTDATELAKYVAIHAAKDGRYALLGPPWTIHLVGFLAKDPGVAAVVLEIGDATATKQPPLVSIEVTAKRRVVISTAIATTAAGFVVGNTYAVRLLRGKVILARAEVTLRE